MDSLSIKDLSLIRGYVAKHLQPQSNHTKSSWRNRSVTHYHWYDPYSYHRPYFRDYWPTRHSRTYSTPSQGKKDKDGNIDNTALLGVVIMAISAIWMATLLPTIYPKTKDFYYTSKINQISKRSSNDPKEQKVIAALKELIQADLSKTKLRRTQGNLLSAVTLFGSGSSFVAAEHLSQVEYARYGRIGLVAAVGIFALNQLYYAYKTYTHDVDHPKSYLYKQALDIQANVNSLEYGNIIGTAGNFFTVWPKVLFSYVI